MKYMIYLFTIATLFSSCANRKEKAVAPVVEKKKEMTDEEKVAEIAEQMKKEQPFNESEEHYKMVQKEIPSDAIARIQRTPCFGRCPAYTLTVFKDGRVEYFGKKFAPREGRYESKVDEAVLTNLQAKANEFGFFGFNRIYDKEAITDLPSTITSVKNDEGMKTIVNRFDGPEGLRDFEMFFDSLFEKLDWKPIGQD